MKDKPKGKKKSDNNAHWIAFTRKELFGWLGLVFGVCALMFFLGILVGRGNAPVRFDIDALQKDLAALKIKNIKRKQEDVPAALSEIADKSDLEFYEKLITGDDGQAATNPAKTNPKPEHKTSRVAPKKDKKALKLVVAAKTAEPQNESARPEPAENRGNFTIQVAAFKDPVDAKRLAAKLLKKGYPVYQCSAKVSGNTMWYRVRVGSFRQKADAGAMLSRLQKDGVKGFLLRR